MSIREPRQRDISGSLQDVVVSDVLQFIQLGKRTGTLVLRRYDETAMIGFHRGRLVAAVAPRVPKVRQSLVTSGLIDRATIESLVTAGLQPRDSQSLLEGLRASGSIDEAALHEVVSGQLEAAMEEILRWGSGTFHFVVDDLSQIDDLIVLPDDLDSDEDEVRSMILEATRIFDARSRRTPSGSYLPAEGVVPAGSEPDPTPLGLSAQEIDEAVEPLTSVTPRLAADLLELHVVTSDERLVSELDAALEDEIAHVRQISANRAGEAAIGTPAPIVLIDLRQEGLPVEILGMVRGAHPAASVVAVVDPGSDFGRVYAAGALAAAPGEVATIVACVQNLIENRRDVIRGRRGGGEDPAVARLRRMMTDLRSGVMSASMALNLMHVISESVERAVLFLVKQTELAVLGAFGHDSTGRLLASSARGLRLPLAAKNVLTRSVNEGSVVSASFADAGLPDPLLSLLGTPASGQVVVFPVQGAQQVISVVYTDNGDRPTSVEDIEILELAAAQVGIAFENELLRRQLTSRRER